MSEEQIYVDTGEGKVVSKECLLVSLGIGSCIVICLYDRFTKVSGMVHVLLGHNPNPSSGINPMRFADSAIPILTEEMVKQGARRTNIKAKIFGGAKLFKSEYLKVGEENTKAVKKALAKENIPLKAEDTGGTHGRNVWFDTSNGSVVVGTVFGPTREY